MPSTKVLKITTIVDNPDGSERKQVQYRIPSQGSSPMNTISRAFNSNGQWCPGIGLSLRVSEDFAGTILI